MRPTPVPLWKSDFEDGWMEESMVANNIGLLMWPTDKAHKDRLVDKLSTMEQRPHDKLVLAAKGHMQYRWPSSKMREQEVCQEG